MEKALFCGKEGIFRPFLPSYLLEDAMKRVLSLFLALLLVLPWSVFAAAAEGGSVTLSYEELMELLGDQNTPVEKPEASPPVQKPTHDGEDAPAEEDTPQWRKGC